MPDIHVDTEHLVALAARLLQVKRVLQGDDHGWGCGDAVGSGGVAASRSGFVRGCSTACAQVGELVARCHADLTAAAESYAAQDRAVATDLATGRGA